MTDAERAELVRRLRNLNSHFDMKILGEAADAIERGIAQNKPSPDRVREIAELHFGSYMVGASLNLCVRAINQALSEAAPGEK